MSFDAAAASGDFSHPEHGFWFTFNDKDILCRDELRVLEQQVDMYGIVNGDSWGVFGSLTISCRRSGGGKRQVKGKGQRVGRLSEQDPSISLEVSSQKKKKKGPAQFGHLARRWKDTRRAVPHN